MLVLRAGFVECEGEDGERVLVERINAEEGEVEGSWGGFCSDAIEG